MMRVMAMAMMITMIMTIRKQTFRDDMLQTLPKDNSL